MSGSWGYSTYRGRPPKGKWILTAVLCVVILAAIAVIVLQNFIVYDGDGKPRFTFLDKSERVPEPGEVDDEVEIILPPEPPKEEPPKEPEAPERVRVRTLESRPLTMESWSAFLAESPACDAVVVPLKEGSRVFFESGGAVKGAVQTEEDTMEAIAAVAAGSRESVAQIGCLRDPVAADAQVEAMGLKNTGHYIFYDGKNNRWLDPGKPDARAYLCGIAAEAAGLGFDEVLLADVTYPTVGKLNKIAYGDTPIAENIETFLTEMRGTLQPLGVRLSLKLSPEVLRTGEDAAAGLELARLAPLVDRIYTEGEEAERAELSALLPEGVTLVLEPAAQTP